MSVSGKIDERPQADRPCVSSEMLEEHYSEFRRIAHAVLRGDGGRLCLQPTELAHEAAIRIAGLDELSDIGRTHFLSLSARMMRHILVDEVRRGRAQKRQASPMQTSWPPGEGGNPVDLEDLDAALSKLESVKPEHASLVNRRFFGGLTLEEIARLDGVSESTIKRQWRAARAWLVTQLRHA